MSMGDDAVYPAGNDAGCGCSTQGGGPGMVGYLTVAGAAVSLLRLRSRRRKRCDLSK
jgi:hypothetical protein